MTKGDRLYDRAWKSIMSALEIMAKSQSKGMRKEGHTQEEVLLAGSRAFAILTVDIARLATMTACAKEPTADELRLFFNTAVDLYTRERLTH